MENYNYSGGDDFLNNVVEEPKQSSGNTGLGIASLILSIVSLFCCPGICCIVSIILSLVERSKYGKMSGLGKAGFIISIISLALVVVIFVIYLIVVVIGGVAAAGTSSYYYY